MAGLPPSHKGRQFHGRLNSKLTPHKLPVGKEITARLYEIRFRQVRLEKGPLRALAQRLDPDRHHGRIDRFAISAALGR